MSANPIPADSTEGKNAHPAGEFRVLLDEANRLAVENGIRGHDLDQMDAIDQMRTVAETIESERYIFNSGTL